MLTWQWVACIRLCLICALWILFCRKKKKKIINNNNKRILASDHAHIFETLRKLITRHRILRQVWMYLCHRVVRSRPAGCLLPDNTWWLPAQQHQLRWYKNDGRVLLVPSCEQSDLGLFGKAVEDYQPANSMNEHCVHIHYEVEALKRFPHYWHFVRVIHRSPVNFPLNGPGIGCTPMQTIEQTVEWLGRRDAHAISL